MASDSYRRDKNHLVTGAVALAATGMLSWGTWVTLSLNDARAEQRAAAERIVSFDALSRERDKALGEAALQSAAALQTQLAQIQTQLTEIQRAVMRERSTR